MKAKQWSSHKSENHEVRLQISSPRKQSGMDSEWGGGKNEACACLTGSSSPGVILSQNHYCHDCLYSWHQMGGEPVMLLNTLQWPRQPLTENGLAPMSTVLRGDSPLGQCIPMCDTSQPSNISSWELGRNANSWPSTARPETRSGSQSCVC